MGVRIPGSYLSLIDDLLGTPGRSLHMHGLAAVFTNIISQSALIESLEDTPQTWPFMS